MIKKGLVGLLVILMIAGAVSAFDLDVNIREKGDTFLDFEVQTDVETTCEFTGDFEAILDIEDNSHRYNFQGLEPTTIYNYKVYCSASGSNRSYTGRTQTAQGLDISNIKIQPSNNNAKILWKTNLAQPGTVLYGVSEDELRFQRSRGTLVYDHSIIMTGLTPGTQYFFKVKSGYAESQILNLTTKLEDVAPSIDPNSVIIHQKHPVSGFVNSESVGFTGQMNEPGFVNIYVNGDFLKSIISDDEGIFSAKNIEGWNIDDANELKLVPIDLSDNVGVFYTQRMVFDVLPPQINIENIESNLTTNQVVIKGTTDEPITLSVEVKYNKEAQVSTPTNFNVVSTSSGNRLSWTGTSTKYKIEKDGECVAIVNGQSYTDNSGLSKGGKNSYSLFPLDTNCNSGTALTENINSRYDISVKEKSSCVCDSKNSFTVQVNGDSFSRTIDLEQGSAVITIKASDRAGNDVVKVFNVKVDSENPTFIYTNLKKLEQVFSKTVIIDGELDEDAIVTVIVNNKNYSVQTADKKFSIKVDVSKGSVVGSGIVGKKILSSVKMYAVDSLGHKSEEVGGSILYEECSEDGGVFNIEIDEISPDWVFEENLVDIGTRFGVNVNLDYDDSLYTVIKVTPKKIRRRNKDVDSAFYDELIKTVSPSKNNGQNFIVTLDKWNAELGDIKGIDTIALPFQYEIEYEDLTSEETQTGKSNACFTVPIQISHKRNQSSPGVKAEKHLDRYRSEIDSFENKVNTYKRLTQVAATMCIFEQSGFQKAISDSQEKCLVADKKVEKTLAAINVYNEYVGEFEAGKNKKPSTTPIGVTTPVTPPKDSGSTLPGKLTPTKEELLKKSKESAETSAKDCTIKIKELEEGFLKFKKTYLLVDVKTAWSKVQKISELNKKIISNLDNAGKNSKDLAKAKSDMEKLVNGIPDSIEAIKSECTKEYGTKALTKGINLLFGTKEEKKENYKENECRVAVEVLKNIKLNYCKDAAKYAVEAAEKDVNSDDVSSDVKTTIKKKDLLNIVYPRGDKLGDILIKTNSLGLDDLKDKGGIAYIVNNANSLGSIKLDGSIENDNGILSFKYKDTNNKIKNIIINYIEVYDNKFNAAIGKYYYDNNKLIKVDDKNKIGDRTLIDIKKAPTKVEIPENKETPEEVIFPEPKDFGVIVGYKINKGTGVVSVAYTIKAIKLDKKIMTVKVESASAEHERDFEYSIKPTDNLNEYILEIPRSFFKKTIKFPKVETTKDASTKTTSNPLASDFLAIDMLTAGVVASDEEVRGDEDVVVLKNIAGQGILERYTDSSGTRDVAPSYSQSDNFELTYEKPTEKLPLKSVTLTPIPIDIKSISSKSNKNELNNLKESFKLELQDNKPTGYSSIADTIYNSDKSSKKNSKENTISNSVNPTPTEEPKDANIKTTPDTTPAQVNTKSRLDNVMDTVVIPYANEAQDALEECAASRKKLISKYDSFTQTCGRTMLIGASSQFKPPYLDSYESGAEEYWEWWHPELTKMASIPTFNKYTNYDKKYEKQYQTIITADEICESKMFCDKTNYNSDSYCEKEEDDEKDSKKPSLNSKLVSNKKTPTKPKK